MTTITYRRGNGRRLARAAALCLLALGATLLRSPEARAQWATSGTTTSTTNNVGIGLPTPSQMFHIHSPGTWAGTRVTTASTGAAFSDGVNFGYDNAYGAIVWNREATPLIFATSNTERILVDAAGNVGIGTTAPVTTLDLRSAVSRVARFTSTGATHMGIQIDSAPGYNSNLVLMNGGAEKWYLGNRTGDERFSLIEATGTREVLAVTQAGRVGVGTIAPASALHVVGDITVDGNINAKYQDVAEWVPSTQKLSAGTVVVLDAERRNHVLASTTSYDTRVAGVISAQPGISLGEAGEGRVLVATTGRVKVKVDASRAPIKIGDLIVTSDVQGVAMRSEPLQLGGRQFHAPGTIVGKALEPLAGGTGEILVLLSLQ